MFRANSDCTGRSPLHTTWTAFFPLFLRIPILISPPADITFKQHSRLANKAICNWIWRVTRVTGGPSWFKGTVFKTTCLSLAKRCASEISCSMVSWRSIFDRVSSVLWANLLSRSVKLTPRSIWSFILTREVWIFSWYLMTASGEIDIISPINPDDSLIMPRTFFISCVIPAVIFPKNAISLSAHLFIFLPH